ncbi:MAG: SirB2 family protein [Burkholderiales bacterium]|nr:SirB2 family protein [Burkholderiales bacterium]
MTYALVKHIHTAAAAVVVLLFLLRGYWMLAGSPMLAKRWVRIVPHVNDTILLAAGIWLATFFGFQPFVVAKLVAVVVYIAAATVALKRGRTKPIRAAAFAVSLGVLGYIFAVAATKSALPFV